MKNIITKNWLVAALGVFVAIYESSSYLFGLDFIPNWIKITVGVSAFIGAVYKKYKAAK